ncbi:MAG: DUF5320 domain-containing protein [Prolixibacteraceae bacterium]|jgi:hypothetical protein|nr:DUF5320 domain-containing protein [Prolixibacteraceae bacterium]
MPGFDKTGPMGQGSQTGRKSGKCNPNNELGSEVTNADRPRRRLFGFLNGNQNVSGRGRGQGLGRSQGRGLGRGQGLGRGRS